MYLLRGVFAYFALLGGLSAIAHFGAQLIAKQLGIAPFRWFDGQAMPGPWWRRFAVRFSSSLFPLLAVIALLFAARLASGTPVPTTRVEVLDGPAKDAGVRAGDRMLSVDAKPVESWEAFRAEVRRGAGEKKLELERQGQKLTVLLTPRDGVIGVRPIYEREPVTAGEALTLAMSAQQVVIKAVLERALKNHDDRATLMGPVAIVKETKTQTDGELSVFFGLVGAYLWPLVAGVHLFDALSLALFRVTHEWTRGPGAQPSSARLARVYQTLLLSLISTALLLLLHALQETSFGDGALLGILLLAPVAMACTVLVTVIAHARWGRKGALPTLAASLLVPCAVVALAVWLILWLRAELKQRGLRVSGLVSTPEQAPAA
jgi:hypothetical protein